MMLLDTALAFHAIHSEESPWGKMTTDHSVAAEATAVTWEVKEPVAAIAPCANNLHSSRHGTVPIALMPAAPEPEPA